MDRELILLKVSSLQRCLSRIEEKRPVNSQLLTENFDLQDIISVNLERAIQICVDISSHILSDFPDRPPETMGETFSALSQKHIIPKELAESLRKSVGFRNISVHQYHKLDWEIIYKIITHYPDNFKEFARCALRYNL
jgi:uncharacterized protein YutE (UPF0331/DUF86 family)